MISTKFFFLLLSSRPSTKYIQPTHHRPPSQNIYKVYDVTSPTTKSPKLYHSHSITSIFFSQNMYQLPGVASYTTTNHIPPLPHHRSSTIPTHPPSHTMYQPRVADTVNFDHLLFLLSFFSILLRTCTSYLEWRPLSTSITSNVTIMGVVCGRQDQHALPPPTLPSHHPPSSSYCVLFFF